MEKILQTRVASRLWELRAKHGHHITLNYMCLTNVHNGTSSIYIGWEGGKGEVKDILLRSFVNREFAEEVYDLLKTLYPLAQQYEL